MRPYKSSTWRLGGGGHLVLHPVLATRDTAAAGAATSDDPSFACSLFFFSTGCCSACTVVSNSFVASVVTWLASMGDSCDACVRREGSESSRGELLGRGARKLGNGDAVSCSLLLLLLFLMRGIIELEASSALLSRVEPMSTGLGGMADGGGPGGSGGGRSSASTPTSARDASLVVVVCNWRKYLV